MDCPDANALAGGMLAISAGAKKVTLCARASSQPGRRMEQYERWKK